MSLQVPHTFSHPHWIRAVMAHVPGAELRPLPTSGNPKLLTAVCKRRLPFTYFESWTTPLTPFGLPSIAELPAEKPLAALLEQLQAPLLLRNIPVDHPVTKAISAISPHCKVLQSWERAALHLAGSYDDWLSHNFDQKRRKEFKRLKARLAEQGQLEIKCLAPAADLSPYIEGFLPLESGGWKGKRGTALANDPQLVAGLKAGLEAMHRTGSLRFWQMALDGKPIASLFALVDGGVATLGKIAHDEAWSKFSPGVLIILEATQSLHSEGGLSLADSNAIPGHPMIDRIWRDRIACMDILVAGPSVSATLFSTLTFFLGTKHASREFAKRIVLRVTGRKKS